MLSVLTHICGTFLKKSVGEEGEPTSINELLVDRVRMITMHDCYMSFSCGVVHRYLMPCHHVYAIIAKIGHYEPSMFHVRWHKLYKYYHGTKYGASNSKRQLMICSHYSK